MVTVVVTAGGGFASCRWCGESGTPTMSSAAAGRSPAVAIAVLHAVKGHACFSSVNGCCLASAMTGKEVAIQFSSTG